MNLTGFCITLPSENDRNEEVYLSMKEFASKQKSEQERSVLVNEKLKMKNL
jgi:hypothetical protein